MPICNWTRLRRTAQRLGESESPIIREALEEYLACEERRSVPKQDNPILQMSGMFEGDSGCRKVSGNVDVHLARNTNREKP